MIISTNHLCAAIQFDQYRLLEILSYFFPVGDSGFFLKNQESMFGSSIKFYLSLYLLLYQYNAAFAKTALQFTIGDSDTNSIFLLFKIVLAFLFFIRVCMCVLI